MSEERVLSLIDSAYGAAVDPTRYDGFLKQLADALGGDWTLLMSHDKRDRRPSISYGVRIDPVVENQYNTHYAATSPLASRIGRFLQPGAVFMGEEIIRESELVRTPYYNEFCLPNDMHYKIAAIVDVDEGGASIVASTRPKRAGPFEAAEKRLLKLLLPHLRRGLQIHHKLALTRFQIAALDRLPIGCVLLGRNGRIQFANRAAEAIFRRKDGISASRDGQLSVATGAAGTRLRNLVRAVTGDLLIPHAGGAVAVPRSNGEHGYSVAHNAPCERAGGVVEP